MAAGVDMSIFAPHSTRAVITSAASRTKIPLETIIKTAGVVCESTFAKYYKKPLMRTQTVDESIYFSWCYKLIAIRTYMVWVVVQ